MSDPTTMPRRPLPSRPEWGWTAWEATVGYIKDEYSADATLTLRAYPKHGITLWQAALSWSQIEETVTERIGIEVSLGDLWQQVARYHRIFKTLEAAVRRPEFYEDTAWFDAVTLESISRLVGVTATVFDGDWELLLLYRPVDVPVQRVQARLVAHQNSVTCGGMGATLRGACRTLFHNATPEYKQYMKKPLEL